MRRVVSDVAIRAVAEELLGRQRRVTVRELTRTLRERYGAPGRTARVSRILKMIADRPATLALIAPDAAAAECVRLREELAQALERARRSEERERVHQDYWATRYAEQVAALERSRAAWASSTGVSHEQYLAAHRRIAELHRRLSRYENPDEPAAES